MNSSKRPLWITWENQRRNREISRRINAILYEWDQIEHIRNPTTKYIYGLQKTALLLLAYKPKVVFCQNPSIVLSFFISVIGKIFGFRVIVDAHNAGLFPLEGRSKILMTLSKLVLKLSFLTIVSNQALKNYVDNNGGDSFVLPDPIPEFNNQLKSHKSENSFNILFICSFATDEPYKNVIEAAVQIGKLYHIYISGNYKKVSIDLSSLPSNVTLLGYVSEVDFVNNLFAVDAIIDLTNREDCLVCGAYEAIAAEKPMIISNSKTLREFFNKGAVYTDNSAIDIAQSIILLRRNYKDLKYQISLLKREKIRQWEILLNDLEKIISIYP